jgi:hypothetical protein
MIPLTFNAALVFPSEANHLRGLSDDVKCPI